MRGPFSKLAEADDYNEFDGIVGWMVVMGVIICIVTFSVGLGVGIIATNFII